MNKAEEIALLLAASREARALGLTCASEDEILMKATGVDPNEASAMADRLMQILAEAPLLEKAPLRKVGRNEPCPCGSGKKHKRCCGAN